MKIGIMGAGNIGGAFAKIWAAKNHEIMLGLRDKSDQKYQAFGEMNGIKLGSVKEAAEFGGVILLAVPYKTVKSVIKKMGSLKGKVIIDCTNALNAKMDGLAAGLKKSAAETIAVAAKGARVVKAFNYLGYQNLADLNFNGLKADAYISGDDKTAKDIAAGLARDAGFDPVDAGGLKQAKLLENLAMLWISLAYSMKMGPNMAFKLLKKQ